jgi:uncharacterized membrane protein
MLRYMTGAVGLSVITGLALAEVALAPVVVVGSAAALAPKYLRRRLRQQPKTGQRARTQPVGASSSWPAETTAPTFGIKRALVKTVTFRAIVTTLDFTTNYVVIGEFATAAGLSTFNLVAGPVFYLAHEAVWNYWGPAGTAVDFPSTSPLPEATAATQQGWQGFTISRALAKTVTFRTIASVMDFATNYVVVGDVATAAGLSAFGFFLGPFVYFAHEKAWDHFSPPEASAPIEVSRASA